MVNLLFSIRLLRRVAFLGALGSLALACAPSSTSMTFGPPASPTGGTAPAPPSSETLVPGSLVEREIGDGETQEHRLAVEAGSYLRIAIEQREVDVAARLLGLGGEEMAVADGPCGCGGPELISLIVPAAGELRLSVRVRDPEASRGLYSVRLEELRPAGPLDGERVAAERALAEARQRGACDRSEERRAALASLAEVLRVWRRIGDRPREAETLNEIGALQWRLGEIDAGLSNARTALSIARETGSLREQARAFGTLGDIENRRNTPQSEVRPLYNEALRCWQDLGDRAGMGKVLYNLGNLHADAGEPDEALHYYEQALPLQEAAGRLADRAFTLAAMALLSRDRGDGARTLDLFNQGLDFARRSGDRSAEAYLLHGAATFLLRLGELQQAIERLRSALELYRALGERAPEARVLTNLGSTELGLGDRDRALGRYREALAIHQDLRDAEGECSARLYIGLILQLEGASEEALVHYDRVLEIIPTLSNPFIQATGFHFVGKAYLSFGRIAEARSYLGQALALHDKRGDALARARTLIELGNADREAGDDAQAEERFREALELGRKLRNFLAEVSAQEALARLQRDRGDLAAARATLAETLKTLDSVRSRVASQRLRVSFLASRQSYYWLDLDILMRLYEKDRDGASLAAALAASERARARGLLDLLAEGRIDVRRGIAEDLKRQEAEIDSRISAFQSRILSGPLSDEKAEQLGQEMRRAFEEREQLEWEIRRRHPRYAAVRNPVPLRLEEIQALLDDRTAFLEYAVGEDRSFLFVVTRDRLGSYILPPASRLAEQVGRIGEALGKPGRRSYGAYLEAASELYRELISPAEGLLAGKPRLIVSPDGPLHFLSFEALLTGDSREGEGLYEGLPYLIRERSVTYVPSASVLAELARPRERDSASPGEHKLFVGFADPFWPAKEEGTASQAAQTRSFVLAGLPEMRRLAQSRHEVDEIARLYPEGASQLYVDRAATEENVKRNDLLKSARRIHFATHGFLNERQPELSGLALTFDGDPREDGLLQVYEIFNLELDADLVVLSACDTGLGQRVSGEGLVGVTRALLYAGARSVVVSLWQVDDASTAELMVDFYRHLDRDPDKAESLRRSKLEMIRQGRYAHPYYWAPFILIGEPR
ncbi:MAG TPA: CHAT domain-containing tetratricopeptide repeat protein [Thermoanaerobaculia bacterium]